MAQLWSDEAGEHYVGRKADEVTSYLHEKRLLGDDKWVSLREIYEKLYLDEYYMFGILFHMWRLDSVLVKRGESGEILLAAVWDSDRARWTQVEPVTQKDDRNEE